MVTTGTSLESNISSNLLNNKEETSLNIHLKNYIQIILSRWMLVAGAIIIVTMLFAIYAFTSPPVYKAYGTLVIYPPGVSITNNTATPDASRLGTIQNYLKTQYQLIVSEPLLEKTFHHFHFYRKKEFAGRKEPLKIFARHFSVLPVRNSFIVKVGFEWYEPQLCARVVEYLQKIYIQSVRQRRMGITGTGLQVLHKKAEELRPKVLNLANQLQEFIEKSNMISLERSQNIIVDRLREISKAHTELQLKRIHYQSRYNNIVAALKRPNGLDTMPELLDNASIRDLKLQLIISKQQLESLLEGKRFGPNHPQVTAVKAQLQAIKERLKLEAFSILRSVKESYKRTLREENELTAVLKEQRNKVFEFNKLSIHYNLLKNNHDAAEQSYRSVAERIEEIELADAAGSKEDNISIISSPRVPKSAVKPRKALLLLFGIFWGTFLGIALSFFAEYFDTSIKSKEEIEHLSQAPVLGLVPAAQLTKNDGEYHELVITQKRSNTAEAFRSISYRHQIFIERQ